MSSITQATHASPAMQRNIIRTALVAIGLLVLLAAWDGVAQPSVEWGAYLGGATDVAVDSSGNAYVTGTTNSVGWVSGGWDTTFGGGVMDGFVVKLNPAGVHLWSTYLGGTGYETGSAIAVDSSGNVYATGYTASPGWVSGGWDTTFGGSKDGYIVKLNPAGAHLWSTYLGGTGNDEGFDITVDSSGNAYATGNTHSSGWVSGGWDTILNGIQDGYVVKLSPGGAHLWSTYLGGTSVDYGSGIAVDSSGNAYVTGSSDGSGWVSGGFDTSFNGFDDSYIVKFNTTGTHLWSTYLGGTDIDYGYDIAVDSSGNVYAAGETQSAGWVSGGWDTTFGGGANNFDGYVVKLDTLGAHLWSTYVGGTGTDTCIAIAVYSDGDLYATGTTFSPCWVSGGWDTTFGGGVIDGFVVKLSTSTGMHVWSSYLGGSGIDAGYGIAVDSSEDVYVTGETNSSDWESGWITSYGGNGFVLKVLDQTGSLHVTITPPEAITAGAQWRRVGTTPWLDSGYTEAAPVGNWTIEFKALTGCWTKPANHAVVISEGSTTEDSGMYMYTFVPWAIWYVDVDNASGPWDGTSWATAFNTIQSAVNAASCGGEVWVAEGTYTGTGDNVVVMASDVYLYGGFSGTETDRSERNWTAHVTTIHGSGERRCLIGANDATLNGFIITGGYNFTGPAGGGMLNDAVSPTIEDCIFQNNVVWPCGCEEDIQGGAMACLNGASPMIEDCIFQYNGAQSFMEVSAEGGAIACLNASPTFVRCTFASNNVEGDDMQGTLDAYNYGGALYFSGGSSSLNDCTFTSNYARDGLTDNFGGAIYSNGASLSLTNCIFTSNDVRGGADLYMMYYGISGGDGLGGAIYSNGASLSLTNCIFRSNHAQGGRGGDNYDFMPGMDTPGGAGGDGLGGALYFNGVSPTLTNCTFTSNLVQGGAGGSGYCWIWDEDLFDYVSYTCYGSDGVSSGGGMYNVSVSPAVKNCILWNDTPNEIAGTSAIVTYSCVQGGYSGQGNIDLNPVFADAEDGDLSLSWGSPCINAGTSVGAPASDILGVSRPRCGVFDMGAYEYEGLTITTQPISQTVSVGNSVVFTVAVSNGVDPIYYQWRHDEGNITDANGTVYTISEVETSDAGAYDCVVEDECGPVTSDAAILTVGEGMGMSVVGGAGLTATILALSLLGALRLRRRTK